MHDSGLTPWTCQGDQRCCSHHFTQRAREHPHPLPDISPNLGALAGNTAQQRVVRYQLPSGHICVTDRVAVDVILETASPVLHWLQPPAMDLPAGNMSQQVEPMQTRPMSKPTNLKHEHFPLRGKVVECNRNDGSDFRRHQIRRQLSLPFLRHPFPTPAILRDSGFSSHVESSIIIALLNLRGTRRARLTTP
jgi:hypothetical protein